MHYPLLTPSSALYKEGTFDLDLNTLPGSSESNHTILSGLSLSELRKKEHGADVRVVAFQGTTSSKATFCPVIKGNFVLCPMIQCTGCTKGCILQG